MKPLLSLPFKAGLAALGLLAGPSAPSFAGPMPQPKAVAPSADIMLVRDSSAGDPPGSDVRRWRRNHSDWRWRRHGDRHHWRHDSWRYRHHYRGGSGFYFGLGIAPAYRYYVEPRRYYRSGGSSAHVRWCYDRYRSYRAWDNTYQPYNGPRRQCYSPYS
jgi:hypothetical protein